MLYSSRTEHRPPFSGLECSGIADWFKSLWFFLLLCSPLVHASSGVALECWSAICSVLPKFAEVAVSMFGWHLGTCDFMVPSKAAPVQCSTACERLHKASLSLTAFRGMSCQRWRVLHQRPSFPGAARRVPMSNRFVTFLHVFKWELMDNFPRMEACYRGKVPYLHLMSKKGIPGTYATTGCPESSRSIGKEVLLHE